MRKTVVLTALSAGMWLAAASASSPAGAGLMAVAHPAASDLCWAEEALLLQVKDEPNAPGPEVDGKSEKDGNCWGDVASKCKTDNCERWLDRAKLGWSSGVGGVANKESCNRACDKLATEQCGERK